MDDADAATIADHEVEVGRVAEALVERGQCLADRRRGRVGLAELAGRVERGEDREHHQLAVADLQHIVSFAVMFLVAAIISGLTERVRASIVDEASAEAQVITFLQQYVPKGKSPMCGNSICQDRRFLARTMPALEAFFHYRNLDVSTLKELARRWKPAALEGFKKAQAHTAMADIHESIEELLHYRTHLLAV